MNVGNQSMVINNNSTTSTCNYLVLVQVSIGARIYLWGTCDLVSKSQINRRTSLIELVTSTCTSKITRTIASTRIWLLIIIV